MPATKPIESPAQRSARLDAQLMAAKKNVRARLSNSDRVFVDRCVATSPALFSVTAEQQHGNPDHTAWLATVADCSGASMDAALAILTDRIDDVVALVTGDATAQAPRPARAR